MAGLSSIKNPRLITISLIILTLVLAAIAVFAAYTLRRKDNVNPTPSSAATCNPNRQDAKNRCCEAINGSNEADANPALGSQCPTDFWNNFCNNEADAAVAACASITNTPTPVPSVGVTEQPTGNTPPECGSPDFAGKVTYLGAGNRIKVINCTNQASSISCVVMNAQCDDANGDPGIPGQCSAAPIQTAETVSAAANSTGFSSVLTCNPGQCGSCQIDIECGGVTEGEFFSSGNSCGGGGGPTRRPSPTPTVPVSTATPTPTPTRAPSNAPTATPTPIPTATPIPSPTPTPVVGYQVQKSASPANVAKGGTVTYTASFKNTGNNTVPVSRIVDDYSDAFTYQAGTTLFTRPNGTTFAKEPVISGGKMTWEFTAAETVSLAPDTQLGITYKMTASQNAGAYPNRICMEVPNGGCADANVTIQGTTQPATGVSTNTLLTILGLVLTSVSGVVFMRMHYRNKL